MGKLIRPTYPAGFSIGLLSLIFIVSFFLSHQIFEVPFSDLKENQHVYIGMGLITMAVIIMFLIIWEEILFPLKVKEVNGGMEFRNHRTKLVTQLLIYCTIPAIFCYIYFEYEVNHVRFFIWAAVCMGAPVLEKIASGVNNYNDFLKMTNSTIEYKNNEKEGCIEMKDIKFVAILTDDKNGTKKIQLLFRNNDELLIDLDEMELEAFYDLITNYITSHYKHLLKASEAASDNKVISR